MYLTTLTPYKLSDEHPAYRHSYDSITLPIGSYRVDLSGHRPQLYDRETGRKIPTPYDIIHLLHACIGLQSTHIVLTEENNQYVLNRKEYE